jgi:hypothetical protein
LLLVFALHLPVYANGPVFQFLPLQVPIANVFNFWVIQNKKESQDAKPDTQKHETTAMIQAAKIATASAHSSATEALPLQRLTCSHPPLEFTGMLHMMDLTC